MRIDNATFTNAAIIAGGAGGGSVRGSAGAPGAGILGANLTITNTGTIAGGGGGAGDAGTFTSGTNVLNVGGTITGNLAIQAGTLQINAAAGGSTVSNRITGAGALIQNNAETLTLSGTNTYTGTTTISGGVLDIRSGSALGAADGTAGTGTAVSSGAVLELQGGIAVGNEALRLAGTGVSGGGALRSVSGANGYGGAITLTDDARINADAGTLTLSGAIAGTGTGVLGQSLTLGGAGNGTLSGTAAGNLAILRKDGAGTWTVTGRGTFDRNATVTGGTLRLQGGGTLSNLSAFVDAAGTAAAVVTGSGSTWTNSGNVFLGSSGAGTLAVSAGGTVTGVTGLLGNAAAATGTATVTGAGSTWSSRGGLTVGGAGTGTLAVQDGGRVSNGNGVLGLDLNAAGTATVTGAGSTWASSGSLYVGNLGAGTLTVTGGGGVQNTDGVIGGFDRLSTGTATVTGIGSTWTNSTGLTVGNRGTGTLTIADGGTVSVGGGTGTMTVAGESGSAGTLAIGAAAGRTAVAAGTLQAGNVVFRAGTGALVFNHTGNPDGSAVTFASRIAGAGRLDHRAGTTILTGANSYTGTTTIAGGTLGLGSAGALGSSGTLSFTGGTLQYGSANQADYSARFSTAANQAYRIDTNGQAVTYASALTSSGGTLEKLGAGTLVLSAANSYDGATTVSGGTLLVTGAPTGAGAVDVATGAAFGGTGSVAGVVEVDGTISAGGAELSGIGALATGSLTLTSTATFRQDVAGPASADRVTVTGAVSLAGTLALDVSGSFAAAVGSGRVFIDNDLTDAVTGRFGAVGVNGAAAVTLADAASTFTVEGRLYRIDYAAGDGNDVAIRDVTPTPPPPPDPTPPGPSAGDDDLVGTSGPDTIRLGLGNDTFAGGAGADLVYGNPGNDLVYGNQDADTLYGGQGDDRAFGGQGDDRLYGNLGNDLLFGNLGADIVYGNQGADIVYGNQGADILYGGQGDDLLYGGQGADTLNGGIGDDTLVGGLGADLYAFGPSSGRDLILGFDRQAGDRIALGGQTYTISSAQNGDALLLLSGGGVLDLAGIRADQVSASDFAA